MEKEKELMTPDSCLNRAFPSEQMFILLGRDAAAPLAIREWCRERIRLGLNAATSAKIREAQQCAMAMEKQRPQIREAMRTGLLILEPEEETRLDASALDESAKE